VPDERPELAAVRDVDPSEPRPVSGTHPAHRHPLSVQIFRFVVTGALCAAVDFGILVLLMFFGLAHTPAKAISFIFGTATSYAINRRWTFAAGPSHRRFIGVLILYAVTFFVQVGLFALLFSALTAQGLQLILVQAIAFVVAQGVATTVNFVVQRVVIFRYAHRHPHHAQR
jgi:putative flippase GtrA